jgi:flagellar protein FliO/FliZ
MTPLSQPVSPLSVGSLTQLTVSLVAIVALIFAISWVVKRLKLAGPRGAGDMAVIDELCIGPRDRIMLIRVGESQLLIGVGASGPVALTPLTTPIVRSAPGKTPAFAERLRDLMRRPGGAT